MSSGEKSRLNVTIDREIKRKAKKKSKITEMSLSSVCERALRNFVGLEHEEIGCRCGAKYPIAAIEKQNIEKCRKCGEKLGC